MINQVGAGNVIIRHLILPNIIENSFGVLKLIAEIDKNIRISLMTQYEPIFRAKEFPEIKKKYQEKTLFSYIKAMAFQ